MVPRRTLYYVLLGGLALVYMALVWAWPILDLHVALICLRPHPIHKDGGFTGARTHTQVHTDGNCGSHLSCHVPACALRLMRSWGRARRPWRWAPLLWSPSCPPTASGWPTAVRAARRPSNVMQPQGATHALQLGVVKLGVGKGIRNREPSMRCALGPSHARTQPLPCRRLARGAVP